MKKTIEDYKMEDRIQMINVTVAGNFLLALILVLPNFVLLENYRAQICLFSALVYFAAQRFYDWRSTPVNVLLFLLYGLLLGIEYFTLGLPGLPMAYDEDYGLSKGVMFDLLVWSLPGIYVCLRIFMIIPLVSVNFPFPNQNHR
jgi:hypothetical protein